MFVEPLQRFTAVSSRLLALVVPLTILASCMTADPRLVAALQRTSVREIRIETAPDITMVTPSTRAKPIRCYRRSFRC
jgi:hypothetical protein